jgi:hypothetical protein
VQHIQAGVSHEIQRVATGSVGGAMRGGADGVISIT